MTQPTFKITEDQIKDEQTIQRKSYRGFNIYKYKKSMMNTNDWNCVDTMGKIRSVVVDNNGEMVCVSPVKSYDYNTFVKHYSVNDVWNGVQCQDDEDHSDENTENIIDKVMIEEYVEGTMINVFYSEYDKRWHISTKSLIDANGSFFQSKKKFSDMFYEVLDERNMKLDDLRKEFCYSFVLRHPENRIVEDIKTKDIILVGVYYIVKNDRENNENGSYSIYSLDIRDTSLKQLHSGKTMEQIFDRTPKIIDCPTTSSVNMYVDDMCYNQVGLMIYAVQYNTICINGVELNYHSIENRSKVRNFKYEYVRFLRGNQPKIDYHFCELLIDNRIDEFLKYYPEYTKDYEQFRKNMLKFERQLYKYYRQCYIQKQRPLITFDYIYRPHMFKLHYDIYKKKLQPLHKRIEIHNIRQYIHNLHPSQIMFVLSRC